jgi:hypothetical protein
MLRAQCIPDLPPLVFVAAAAVKLIQGMVVAFHKQIAGSPLVV